jgi:hypothetical protein
MDRAKFQLLIPDYYNWLGKEKIRVLFVIYEYLLVGYNKKWKDLIKLIRVKYELKIQ